MFESRAINGSEFEIVPSQPGVVMQHMQFVHRFTKAIDKCIQLCQLESGAAAPERNHFFALDQFSFNGTQLFADEVVVAPNECKFLGDGFSLQSILDTLWISDRFPRYVHLGIEEYDNSAIQFIVQFSCCYHRVYDPDHPNSLFPVRVLGKMKSSFRGSPDDFAAPEEPT